MRDHPHLSTIYQAIDRERPTLIKLAQEIHARPELCYEEHFASQLLSQTLQERGFSVEKPFATMETAFCAKIGSSEKPVIAILAEYDALPEVGHACGHNLIGTGAIGAAVGLQAVITHLPGQVWILGTPAEEGGGGKIKMIETGVFASVDAAMMFHPFDRNLMTFEALAMHTVDFEFTGQPSHAAAAPWDGNSAVSGVIQTFNLIDNIRMFLKDKTRIHGIITHGGGAANVIPEYAACRFIVRAAESSYLDEVVMKRVIQCAEAAALATGTTVKTSIETGYKNLKTNQALAQTYGQFLQEFGLDYRFQEPESPMGSTDMGDVSQVVPSIHPMMAICNLNEAMCHQHEFAEMANSEKGYDAMIQAAKAMAGTTYRLLTEPELLQQVKTEFGSQA